MISISNHRKNGQKTQVQIDLPDLKMQALNMSLTAKDKDFEAEINAYALHLYEKNVPKETRNFLAAVEGESPGTPTKEQ